jgi:hypothetical protein
MRLRIDSARNGEANELQARVVLRARLGVAPGGDHPAFHGAHTRIDIDVGGQCLGQVLLLRDARVEAPGLQEDRVTADQLNKWNAPRR